MSARGPVSGWPTGLEVRERAIDLRAFAHDASHYLLVPEALAVPRSVDDVKVLFAAARAAGRTLTFRSGGTSLSGQGVTDGVLVDTRRGFRRIDISADGRSVRVGPGATVRQVNARLARHGRRLGPDPASEIACTVGGVVANNSSGMACGTTENSYRTIESLLLVLADGTVIDTGADDADERLAVAEPGIHAGLLELRRRLLASPGAVAEVRRQFSMKNTMGYGINALLDFERPVDILAHLVIGSEGTLAFVAEARFATVPIQPAVTTGLLLFPDLAEATAALPSLVAAGLATVELMDAAALRVAQAGQEVPEAIAGLRVKDHTALLVELHAADPDTLASAVAATEPLLRSLPLAAPFAFSTDAAERAALWRVRKGLYAAVAGARPPGTTALLEDVAVPVERLLPTCTRLIELFARHGYEDAVVFGHAKDGNLHFMLVEDFGDDRSLARYRAFTEELVELVLAEGGTLKAEHGTGRAMAPFVRRQYGDELYGLMRDVKRLMDPEGMLNPGVLLSDDSELYLRDLKVAPRVEHEVDRCVECGYCEPGCPSKDLTLTPRQRIALRREIAAAADAGDERLRRELERDYGYDGVDTCAVDGLCAMACPVGINTGDLVRRLRAERRTPVRDAAWSAGAANWAPATRIAANALSLARRAPAALVEGATDVGRAILGAEILPRYGRGLPAGGAPRRIALESKTHSTPPSAVLFAACVGSMFGSDGGVGATEALRRLAARAGVALVAPEGIEGLCCGTPWKSKGHLDGYRRMSDRVIPALLAASDGGRLPIVCDAASCTEGLETLLATSANEAPALRFVDATEFARDVLLPALPAPTRVGSVMVHRTCSTAALGADGALDELAAFAARSVHHPDDWSCCAFAGDRGMLHPELTASATSAEAAEVAAGQFDAYVSANRTCEIGMTRATGRTYRHVLELVEDVTRP
ncbi:FAD-binding and (Fe-S)-binding domain-containing protein [Leifsonia sp. TF02-11]|uniref:FAD-binding and (Fe-S)-binding domain-containing protein n=1 Tax=Leifsonia sp. TF02-11 TaxID=2815212 RepID=UPI0027DE057A|nr:FAD-binding and (Fe-S)-binding domain-containing protein [Leifsonia sp. TF02-11]